MQRTIRGRPPPFSPGPKPAKCDQASRSTVPHANRTHHISNPSRPPARLHDYRPSKLQWEITPRPPLLDQYSHRGCRLRRGGTRGPSCSAAIRPRPNPPPWYVVRVLAVTTRDDKTSMLTDCHSTAHPSRSPRTASSRSPPGPPSP
jgi:hypothetical protein